MRLPYRNGVSGVTQVICDLQSDNLLIDVGLIQPPEMQPLDQTENRNP